MTFLLIHRKFLVSGVVVVVVKSFLETDPLSVNFIASTFYVNKHSLASSVQSLATVGLHISWVSIQNVIGHYVLLVITYY